LAWQVDSDPSWPVEHVQRLAPADLADDDPVRPHPERVAEQRPDGDLPGPLGVGGPGLQGDDVGAEEPELGRLLDRDEPFAGGDRRAEGAQERGLAAARPAGDDDVKAGPDRQVEKARHGRGHRPAADEAGEREGPPGELPDGDRRAPDRQRRDDRVEPAAVR